MLVSINYDDFNQSSCIFFQNMWSIVEICLVKKDMTKTKSFAEFCKTLYLIKNKTLLKANTTRLIKIIINNGKLTFLGINRSKSV